MKIETDLTNHQTSQHLQNLTLLFQILALFHQNWSRWTNSANFINHCSFKHEISPIKKHFTSQSQTKFKPKSLKTNFLESGT